MDGQVTTRGIAYAAVHVRHPLHHSSWLTYLSKLHFSLCDASQWVPHYNGFNYEEFYEFIIDFFEADQTPEGKAASRELFNWWNKYVILPSPSLLLTPPQTSFPKVCRYSSTLIWLSAAVVTCNPTRTASKPLTPPTLLVSFSSTSARQSSLAVLREQCRTRSLCLPS